MGLFSQILVDVVSGAANAGLKSMEQQRATGGTPTPAGGKKKPACSSCAALREVERAKQRIAKGKL